ncbi:FHA domain-containing protein [Mycolicibacterium hippocampi]|uniref:FHA domain-containing protein n=1 Tax=Mycolicibacterium hippocampi TaxID=659824 RepID=UPI0035196AE7
MQLDVKVVPGAAAVLRYGSVIAVTAITGGAQLVDLRETVRAAADSDDPATALFQALADGDTQFPVVAVVAKPEGADVVLLGDLEVRAETMVGITHLNGRAAAGVSQQTLTGPLTRISVGQAENEIPDGFGLQEGVVPGGGVVIVLSPSGPVEQPTAVLASSTLPSIVAARPSERADPLGHPATDPEAPAPDEQSFESVPLVGTGPQPRNLSVSRAPLPLLSGEQSPPPAEQAPVSDPSRPLPMVKGVNCPLGHFNHPHAVNCAWCGRGMLQVSRIVVDGPRPPLGVLLVDEQATFTLDADYVVGRMPSRSPEVDGEAVRELVLTDPDRLVSRVHAKIALRDWDVTVEDGGSDNGTWVLAGNLRTPPHRLTPNSPYPLRPGDQVHIGRHRLTFHSHHLL